MICQKQLYHCNVVKNEDGNIIGYEPPTSMYVNYQPLNGEEQALAYGSSNQRHWRYYAPTISEGDVWHVDDLVYLDGAVPDTTKDNGQGANARVTAVLPQNVRIRVLFEEIVEIG